MADYGDAQVVPGNTPMTFANIRTFVGEMLEAGVIPMLLGGDHGITGPIVSAFADHYGSGTVAVVQLDAHTDTAPIPEGHMGNHGTQCGELIETGAIRGPHLIQLAIRGGWPDPAVTVWMEDAGVRTHYMAEIFRRGFDAVLDDAIAEAKRSGAEHVFLTLTSMPPTPPMHPEPGRLSRAA